MFQRSNRVESMNCSSEAQSGNCAGETCKVNHSSDNSPNLFAHALKELLDGTGLHTREQWAALLGVTAPAITQWVKNRTLPRPDHLRMVLDVVTESDEVPQDVLTRFWDIASRPAAEVVPNPRRVGNSISEYVVAPVLSTFEATLSKLPGPIQEDVLHAAIAMGRLGRPTSRTIARRNDQHTVQEFLRKYSVQ